MSSRSTSNARSRYANGGWAQPILWLALCFALTTSIGCATVKPWERDTHALSPMQAEDHKCHRFERNIEVYREGAVGANGGKSGGGCGCS